MTNSSFLYDLDADTPELSTAYMPFFGDLREVEWTAMADMGMDVGPDGVFSSLFAPSVPLFQPINVTLQENFLQHLRLARQQSKSTLRQENKFFDH